LLGGSDFPTLAEATAQRNSNEITLAQKCWEAIQRDLIAWGRIVASS